jgi:hypothetical protein
MHRLQIAGLTGIVLILLTAGCAKNVATDDALANDIKAKLYSDATTKPANINVAVKSGVVTLTGDVPSSDVELQAMKVVNATTGVRSVEDQLKVNPAMAQLPDAGTPQNPPVAANPSGGAPPSAPAPNTAPPPVASAPPLAAPPVSQPAPTGSPVAETPRERPKPVEHTIASGTGISVRTIDAIDSKRNDAGQVFRGSLAEGLSANGTVVIPAGAPVSILLEQERDAGRIKGQSMLEVRLASIDYRGKTYKVDTTSVTQTGKGGRGKSTAVRTGIGAAAGAVIGAIAGGGKGAAIGSAAGGGAGFGVNVFTHGQQVQIPSETILEFTLQSPLTVERRR